MPILGFLLQLVIGVVLSLGASLIQQALAPRSDPQQRQARGFRGTVQTGGEVPQSFLVGTIGVPGKLEYRNSWGDAGGTPNAYLVDVVSFGDIPVAAFTGLYVNSRAVSIPTTGLVTQGYPVPEYAAGGADHLWWAFLDGSQTSVSTYLNGKFGADATRPWLTDMIGRGIPYVTLTALVNQEVWAGFPTYLAQLQGIKLYDPRKDSTAGGSGTHRWGTESTYEWSDNNAVVCYNILRGVYYGGAKVWGGAARAAQLPYAVWAAAMNVCDELVTLTGGGSEKRFRAGREIFVSERPADVVTELLAGANMRLAHSAGVFYPLAGAPGAADGSFTDADVLVTDPTTLEKVPALDDVVNGATASYLEPSQAWETKETAPYYRSDLEALDDNRRQVVGLDLATTFSGTQAQRILKAAVEESRRFVRHVVPLRPAYGQYRPLQVLSWTSDANGYAGKLFLITAKTEDPWGRIVFGLQEIDPADHNWTPATDQKPLSFAPMTPIRPPAQLMTGWAVAPYTHVDSAANARRPGIQVSYAGLLVEVRGVRVQIRRDGETNPIFDSDEYPYDVTTASPSNYIIGDFLLPNQAYEARGRFVPFSGRETSWSAWLDVTTPDVRLSYADLDATLQNMQTHFGVQIRELTEAMQLATALSERQDASNFRDRLSLIDKIILGDDEVSAAYIKAILLALGADGAALADAIEAVEAASGDIMAGLLTRMSAFAGPGGGWSRYGVQARVDVNQAFAAAASLYLEAKSDGSSRIVLKAGETYIVDNSDNILALFKAGGAYFDVARIQDADIVEAKIASAAITNAKIANGAITNAKIGNLEVDNAKIANGAITNAKIGNLEVDNAKISNLTIGTEKYSGNSIIIAGFTTNTSDFDYSSDTDFVSITITTNNGKVVVTANAAVHNTAPAGNDYQVGLKIKKNGVVQIDEVVEVALGGKQANGTLVFVDTSPGTLSNTYTLSGASNGTIRHIFSAIVAENHKNA